MLVSSFYPTSNLKLFQEGDLGTEGVEAGGGVLTGYGLTDYHSLHVEHIITCSCCSSISSSS